MDKNKKLLREGLEKALEIIERHLETVKKDSHEVAAGMLLSQTLILEQLGNIDNNDGYNCSSQSNDNINKNSDKILDKLKMVITNQGIVWYGATESNKVFEGKYQYGILEISIEGGVGYYGEHGDKDDFIIDTSDMLYYSGFQMKK